jgi:glycosyltransferase involved in cell wall biosynthesis
VKVFHVHRICGIGGSERHLLTLLPALRAHGVDARVLGLDDASLAPRPFYDALEHADVPYLRLDCLRDLDPRLAVQVAQLLRRERPDIVHTHLVHGDVYGLIGAIACSGRLVSTKHNDDRFRTGSFRHLEQLLTRRAARVLCITASLARFNVDVVGLPPAKVQVVHYGLDAPPDAWGEADTSIVAPDRRVLLAVSRLTEQKGLDVMVRALPAILDVVPEATLVVLGEGPDRGRLERLARELDVAAQVCLPGRTGDVAAWLRRSEIFVHPARWEGFGLVLLEAMHAGRAIVASRVSSIPEIVVDGETGLLVEPDDPRALATAVLELLGDPARSSDFGQAGGDRARALFSVERMAEATIAVYDAVGR